ncbi:MAG: PEP-utilizing enzyme, partial [Bacilli bacterium]|nr:PEP-utilizing enzyme [Bacilli bacterium]
MQYKGRIIFEGYALADILVYEEANKSRQRNFDQPGHDEYARFEYARELAIKSFDELYQTSLKTVGEEKAALFQTYRLMAEDIDFEDLVRSNINDGQTAENAIANASKQIADSFAILDDEYMKQRAIDVVEVGKNLINVLSGNNQLIHLTKPTILICNDLAASVLMKLNRKFLKGLVLINGNENSHVAIFARTLELPTICGLSYFNLSSAYNGKKGIVDAIAGRLVIEPTEEETKKYKQLEEDYLNEGGLLKKYIGKPTV